MVKHIRPQWRFPTSHLLKIRSLATIIHPSPVLIYFIFGFNIVGVALFSWSSVRPTLLFSLSLSFSVSVSALAITGTMLTFPWRAFMNSTSNGFSLPTRKKNTITIKTWVFHLFVRGFGWVFSCLSVCLFFKQTKCIRSYLFLAST